MNCLTEALALAAGNGSLLATHAYRKDLFLEAGRLVVDLARRWYEQDDASVLPRAIASFAAFENAMSLDIAMGGSTTPCCTCWRPRTSRRRLHHAGHRPPQPQGAQPVQGRACHAAVPHGGRAPGGGVIASSRARPRRADQPRRADGALATMGESLDRWDVVRSPAAAVQSVSAPRPAACRPRSRSASRRSGPIWMSIAPTAASATSRTPTAATAASPCSTAISRARLHREDGGVDKELLTFAGPARVLESQEAAVEAILADRIQPAAWSSSATRAARGPGMQEMLYRRAT